jgi:hypothetical protein
MREADEINGETGPAKLGVKGNLTFAYKHVWPATSGVSPVGLDSKPENAADCAQMWQLLVLLSCVAYMAASRGRWLVTQTCSQTAFCSRLLLPLSPV